jgi:hypothetical protein
MSGMQEKNQHDDAISALTTLTQFLDHLTNNVMPELIDRLAKNTRIGPQFGPAVF